MIVSNATLTLAAIVQCIYTELRLTHGLEVVLHNPHPQVQHRSISSKRCLCNCGAHLRMKHHSSRAGSTLAVS